MKSNYKHGYSEEDKFMFLVLNLTSLVFKLSQVNELLSLTFKLVPLKKSKSLVLILISLINYSNKSTDFLITISGQKVIEKELLPLHFKIT
jgi:hypothetical protein